MGLYNAQVGQQNAGLGLLGSLGAAGIAAYPWSDIRLKSNIRRIGTHRAGVGVYEYEIFGRREIGVIAQELAAVRPDAVHRHASGFLTVDYGAI
jgi:hypothetical protein